MSDIRTLSGRCLGRAAVLALLAAVFVPTSARASAEWWNSSWSDRRTLTFGNGGQAENLVDFPVMVRLDSGRIDYAKVQNAGEDLRFVDANNMTVLAHEIELWNESGSSYVWVKVPQIDASSTTDRIYMYYGNPTAADGQNPAAVWNSGYTMVQHFQETSGTHFDSTSNNNDSILINVTAQGTASGQIDGADQFGGAPQSVRVGDSASVDMGPTDSFTVEAWVQTTATGWRAVVSKEDLSIRQYQIWLDDTGALSRANFWLVSGATSIQAVGTSNVRDGAPHYLVGRWDEATSTVAMLVDGTSEGSWVDATLGDLSTSTNLFIGKEGDGVGGDGEFSGIIDEVRISKTARSDAWIRAQNLSMRDTFITFSSEPIHRFTNVTAQCGPAANRSPLDKVSQRKIVRDASGNRYLVYSRFIDGGGCTGFQQVNLARSTDGGATWTETVLFGPGGVAWSTASTNFIYPAIDRSAQGDELHVVVQDATGARILYTRNVSLATWDQAPSWTCANGGRNTGGACSYDGAEHVNGNAITTASAPVVTVDLDGLPHVAYEAVKPATSFKHVYWRFYRPGLASWSGEVQVSQIDATPVNLDPSIDFGRGPIDAIPTYADRVHFLFKEDRGGSGNVDTFRYAYAQKTGVETFSLTVAPWNTGGANEFWLSYGTGIADTALGGSIVAYGGQVFAVGGLSGGLMKFAKSSLNGSQWIGKNGGLVLSSAGSNEQYPASGFALGSYDHRIMAGDGGTPPAHSSSQYGYLWDARDERTSPPQASFEFRTRVQSDLDDGQLSDRPHFALEKKRPDDAVDFAYCWYVSSDNAAPPPTLTTDEIRCNVEPTVFYRSIGASTDTESGTATVTDGSDIVDGSGTTWITNNRGRGDVITLAGADYAVRKVLSETQLQLTRPYEGTGGALAYDLARMFDTIQKWEDCISYRGGTDYCPGDAFDVGSASLVADNRVEIGIAYKKTGDYDRTIIDGSTTDFVHTITLTADPGNRNLGIPNNSSGIGMQNVAPSPGLQILDPGVTVEWIHVFGGACCSPPTYSDGIWINYTAPALGNARTTVRNVIVSSTQGDGIVVGTSSGTSNMVVDLINNNVFDLDGSIGSSSEGDGIRLDPTAWDPGADIYVLNNTVYLNKCYGIHARPADNSAVVLRNNVSIGSDSLTTCAGTPTDYRVLIPHGDSANNLAGDATGVSHSPGGGGQDNVPLYDLSAPYGVNFVKDSVNNAGWNMHVLPSSVTIDAGASNYIDVIFQRDTDTEARPAGSAWDLGFDEQGGTTAVEMVGFAAVPGDSTVVLGWETASELDNLGFHLYRSVAGGGPWTRITSSLIPGLGSSPQGAAYSWTDTGLVNGTQYFYRLEDIDTASVSTFHGPVSAVPQAASAGHETPGEPSPGEGTPGSGEPPPPGEGETPPVEEPEPVCSDDGRCLYGSPGEPTLNVLSRTADEMIVELHTPGFVAAPDPAGVLVDVAGFASPTQADAVDLPFKRAVLDAVVGRRARLVSIEAQGELSWAALRPAALAAPGVDSRPDGTVRAVRARTPLTSSALGVPRARLAGSAFMGHTKKLALDLYPLRWDPAQEHLVLSRTLTVRIAFVGEDSQETGAGSLGRRNPRTRSDTPVVFAHLHTTSRGLHAVPYESVFPRAGRPLPLEALRLVHDGTVVPVHVEPPTGTFGPGSILYFHVDREAASTDFSGELSFALERTSGGVQMGRGTAAPLTGPLGSAPLRLAHFETNRIYQSGLLLAPDVWLWDFAQSGMTKNVALDLARVDLASALSARVRVFLQGASDAGVSGEHHLSFALNGVSLGETSFAGMVPHLFEGTIAASSLIEGTNTLTFTNVGDTGVVSRVFLDRVEVEYPETSALLSGRFSGSWTEEGVAQVALVESAPDVRHSEGPVPGLGPKSLSVSSTERSFVASPGQAPQDDGGRRGLVTGFSSVFALDVTDPAAPLWLSGLEPGPGSVRMQVELGRRYQVITPDGVLVPRVSLPVETGLRDTQNQADYILVAPRAFMDAAQPLLLRRESQGLTTFAASLEDIAQDFGGGAPSAEAIREFLAFAYHSWQQPSARYVLLFGDASFDPRNFTGFDQGAPLPALWAKTSYLWTASDPAIAAVNGEDLLPDLALGRLPATNLAQAYSLVQKVLDWEDAGYDLSGNTALVADNPDIAGDFEADIEDIRQSFLAPRNPQSLLIRTLGASTRPAILDAMNGGLSLLSYVGHGGSAVWASENVLNSFDPPSLLAQPQQPFMLTMNCLNGYFVQPNLDSLAEAFLKAEGRGTIAAFSPSGLSLDGPAHVFHRALVSEIVNGSHQRLGDAVLAAQQAYAFSGHMPELLGIYSLLGDPAMKILP